MSVPPTDISSPGSSSSSPPKRKGKAKKKDLPRLPYQARLNPLYHSDDLKQKISDGLSSQSSFEDVASKASVLDYPFKACSLPKFIRDEQFLEGLRDELSEQIFYEKNNDLYKFQQSDDLKKIHAPHVRAIRKLLYEDFLDWLIEVTGINLSNKVDLTCSKYDYTDVLLCHDDELEGRRIAFILYLVPPWKELDGGTLDLFNMDENGQPKDIVKSLMPEWNKLVFFEVTAASHHQVAEVLTEDKTRLSINGWFHGPPVQRPSPYQEPSIPTNKYLSLPEETINDWINPVYLDPDVQSQIQEKFENDSEIELQGFLKDEKYFAVMEAMKGENVRWCERGPPNKRHYHSIQPEKYPEIIKQCLEFLQSEAMFLTLSNLTGLTLHPLVAGNESSDESDGGSFLANKMDTGEEDVDSSSSEKTRKRKRRRLNSPDNTAGGSQAEEVEGSEETADSIKEYTGNARCRAEVRRWSHGCYTLVHDTDREAAEFGLDAMLFCSCKGWQPEFGGYTSYIAKGEDEELLTVSPAENSLALVYRDKDTLKFVKHLNDRVKELHQGPQFYDFSVTYYE